MRLNGFELSAIYDKSSSALPRIINYNISTDLPHKFVEDDTADSQDIYLVMIPGYIYNISCRGSWNFYLGEEATASNLIAGCGCYDGDMEFLWTGYYHTDSTNYKNVVKSQSDATVIDIMFTNMDYNHGYSGAPYEYNATTTDSGCFMKIKNVTDDPVLLHCKYHGHKVKWSTKTQQAWYSFVDYLHIDQITDLYGEVVVNRFAGYHDKYQLMKYLNAYWESLTLFNDNSEWELDKELAVYQDDDTWA